MCMDEFGRNRLVHGMMALLEDQTRRDLSNGIQARNAASLVPEQSAVLPEPCPSAVSSPTLASPASRLQSDPSQTFTVLPPTNQVSKLSSMTDTISEPRYLYLKLGQDGRQVRRSSYL